MKSLRQGISIFLLLLALFLIVILLYPEDRAASKALGYSGCSGHSHWSEKVT